MGFADNLVARVRWLLRRLPDRVVAEPLCVHGYCGSLQVWTVRWDNMRAVYVETTDHGPEEDNCFLILEDRNDSRRIPSETPGFPNVVNALAGCLDGIDEEALIQSMGWQENRTFVIWERPED